MVWMDSGPGTLRSTRRRPRVGRDLVDIKLVVFDLAGTLIDHGSLAPLEAFVETFHGYGVELA